MSDFLYPYPTLYSGTLVRRYKRFLADVELDRGDVVTAHCPNTGPMTGVSTPGSAVHLSYSDNPKRKLSYTWELIRVEDNAPTWVGINTGLPNRVMKQVLERRLIPELGNYDEIRSEVRYGSDNKSRVDFCLRETGSDRPIYLEVKNTTWAQGTLALFPDTKTTRGQKHLRELTALIPEARGVMLYFINRADCDRFSPGESADPKYAELLREGISAGLEVLPCRFEVTPEGIRYLGLAKLEIGLS